MNVLVLNDRGAVLSFLAEAIEREGFTVLRAENLHAAQRHWERRAVTPVDLFVIDLNLSTEGLRDSELEETRAGLFSGWVWFRRRVLAEAADMRSRAIIHSNYLAEFCNFVSETERAGIQLVEGGERESLKGLIKRIKRTKPLARS